MKVFLYVALYLLAGFLFLVFVEPDDDAQGCMLAVFWPVWLALILIAALGFLVTELAKRIRR